MVSTQKQSNYVRSAEASCTECKKLHTSCYSFIREAILSDKVVVCDFARYGCTKYEGPGQHSKIEPMPDNTRALVYETLKSEKKISLRVLAEKLSLDKQIVSNNIYRLRKKGIPVHSQSNKKGDVIYKLATM